jgi:YD repeat-containing protein
VAYAYDVLGRRVRSTFPDGTATEVRYGPLRRELWDGEDLREGSAHEGTPLVQEEDGLGRVVAVTERLGASHLTTRFGFDGLGRRVGVVNAAGHETRYGYDGLGRVVEVEHPEAGRRRFEYDEEGNVRVWRDAEGKRVEREYDVLGRLREERYVGREGEGQGRVRYHYDRPSPRLAGGDARWARGRLTWVEDFLGEEHFAYDAQGRLARLGGAGPLAAWHEPV